MIFTSYPKFTFEKNKKTIIKKIESVIKNGNYINSNEVKKFEKNFSNFIGTSFAASVGNATDAIYLSLIALGVKKGDEIITVSHTATATATAILRTGAKPTFCDISEKDFNINIDLIEKNISKRTKVIIPVHLYGQSCDMDLVTNLAKKYKLFVLEDCSQCAGSFYKDKKLGSLGDVSCFSFFPTKNLSTFGDGGCVVSNNKKIIDKVKSLREYGWDSNRNATSVGINSRLDEIHAAILNIKLKSLNKDNNERRFIAKKYYKGINNNNIHLPKENSFSKHVYHLFVIRLKSRNKFIEYMKNNNIFLGIHYKIPVHKQKILKKEKIKLPVTEKIAKEVVSLPIYIGLKEEQQQKIIYLINNFS